MGGQVGEQFDEAAAARPCQFFERYLVLPETGQPFALQDWQREMLSKTFGRKHPDGTRVVRTLYNEIAKKNGKSSFAAGVALYMLCADGELSAEVYSVAGDRSQASIIFDTARKMVEASPALSRIIRPYRYSLIHEASGSSYKVLSAEASTKDGIKASAILFDELHEQPDRRLWDVLRGSGLARRQPLTLVTTTAGHDRHSIGWEVHDYATRVRDGKLVDPSFYPVIYAASDTDPIDDPATWRKANPSLGVTFAATEFARLYHEAVAAGPARLNSWKRYHLNLWTANATAWLPMSDWEQCGGAALDPAALVGRTCYPGIDLSSTTDLTAAALVFPREGGGYDLVVKQWMPRANVVEAEQRDGVPYRQWANEGWLELTEGSAIDHGHIKRRLLELFEQYPPAHKQFALDDYNAWQLMAELQAEGYEPAPVSMKARGLSAPSKELLKVVIEHKINHGGNPLLSWQAANVEVVEDHEGNIRPVKGKGAARKRIDGIVATVMAMSRAMLDAHQPPPRPSVYETRGVFVL